MLGVRQGVPDVNIHVTVAVIAYNSEGTLRECLEAVFSQDFPRTLYEVMLVDAGSTDATLGIARDFSVRIFVEKGCTRGRARNICLKEARGEIVVMVDSDVICPRDWLSKAIEVFRDPSVAIISGYHMTPKPELGLIGTVIYYLTSGRRMIPSRNSASKKSSLDVTGGDGHGEDGATA